MAISNEQILSEVGWTLKLTTAEIIAGATPANYGYAPGNARRYGAVGDGVTLDTTAIANTFASNPTGPILLPGGPYNFTLALSGNKGIKSFTEAASKDVWYWGRDYSGTKAIGTGTANLGWGPAGFMFDIRNDVADAGADFVRALYGRTVFGGTAVKGGRIGVLAECMHQLGVTNSANTNRNYVGVTGTAYSLQGDGGADTATNAKGAYFGLNGIARLDTTAINVFEAAGGEFNVYAKAASTAKYHFGISIAGFREVHAATIEGAVEIGGGTDSGYGPDLGWNFGILFSNVHGSDPTNANSVLIGSFFSSGGIRTIKTGLDTSNFTCTSGIVLGPNLVLTDNSLILGASGANISIIQPGNNVAAANLDIYSKGGGAVRIYDGIAGTIRMFIDAGSGIRMVPLASGNPVNNGELMIQATSNTSLTFKFKGSDATIRSASLTLV